MTRIRRSIVFVGVAALITAACGVPTGESTFEPIDGDELPGGLNDATTTTTSTTTTTTTMPITPDPVDTSTSSTTMPPPAAPVEVFFISRGVLQAVTVELDPRFEANQLIAVLEAGPPTGTFGIGLESFVEEGLIVGQPTIDGGVITIELDGRVFNEIGRTEQRQAIAQVVFTFLSNLVGVGQVGFLLDGEPLRVLTDGGSQLLASVNDFDSLRPGSPRSANGEPDEPSDSSTTTMDVPE